MTIKNQNGQHSFGSDAPAPNADTHSSSDDVVRDEATQDDKDAALSSSADTEGANTADEPKSENPLLDIVKDVIEAADTGDGEAGQKPPTDEKAEAKKEDGESDEGDEKEAKGKADSEDLDEDGKPLPFHKHKRWQQIKTERDQYRKDAEAFKADAEQYRTITNYMQERNLSAEEVGQGFQVMDLIKNSPEQALVYLEGAVDTLRQYLGKTLPDDLYEAVDRGEISEQRALELSEARAAQSRAAEQNTQTATQLQELQAAQARQQQTLAIGNAVTAWERQQAQIDPDFSKKVDLIAVYAKALRADAIANGQQISTPQAAVAIAKQAYEQATARLGAANRRQPTDPVPTSTVSAKRTKPAAPQTLEEAVRLGASMPVSSG